MPSLVAATSPRHAQMRRQSSGNTSDEQQHLSHRGHLPFVPITGLGQQEVPLVAVLATATGDGSFQQQHHADLNPPAMGNANPTQSLQNALQTVLDLLSDDDF